MRLLIIFVSLITYLETVISNIGYRLIAIGLSRLIRRIRRSNKALEKEILSKTTKAIRYSRYW